MLDLRKAITRTLTYSAVSINVEGETPITFTVAGETTEQKEMMKYLKANPNSKIPTITVFTFEEKRAMNLDTFIANSVVVENEIISNNESEEN